MAKNRSTLHLNGEAVGNGGIRYVKKVENLEMSTVGNVIWQEN